ncbi:MAG: histone deacetylase [Verrucomicrobia bacterium]|nr:histone deacetylase [Verrucomicrobiota bacterium]
MVVITDERCMEYQQLGHPERPARVRRTLELLRSQTLLPLEWDKPQPVNESQLHRVHSSNHLARLTAPEDFDPDTPAYPRIREHAERSVGGALQAMERALGGERAFSLMRPPGHHATVNAAMGFCYLNNTAIAVLEALDRGIAPVAVYDFDVHHCNGTEDILLGREGCRTFSIHQFPAYPGTGESSYDNARNFPVPPGAERRYYRDRLQKALEELAAYEPRLIAVSAGFDAHRDDPLSHEYLEEDDFYWLGRQLRQLNRPAFAILEGGYSRGLPQQILAFLLGWEGH